MFPPPFISTCLQVNVTFLDKAIEEQSADQLLKLKVCSSSCLESLLAGYTVVNFSTWSQAT